MTKIAVFISGAGTNLRTILEFCQSNPALAMLSLVICNKANAGGLKIAHEFGVPSVIISTKMGMEAFELEAQKHLQGIDLICLAGFMRVLTPFFTKQWEGRMINIHPSLLPAFKGADAMGDALALGVKITGCTVHYVVAEIDSGEIICQKAVEIVENETKESLKVKMQKTEREAYGEALLKILNPIAKTV